MTKGRQRLRGARTPGRRGAGLALAAAAVLLASGAWPLRSQQAAVGPAAIVTIRKEITDVTTRSVERRVREALDAGARTIVFELDTPGGMVTSALDICKHIKGLPPDVRTVAWVNDEAYSAGAMIAVACRRIVMTRASSIGDCAPIMVAPVTGPQELAPAERAKAESPVLQEFRDSAARNGYDPLLCRAMVSVGEVVWWVENVQTGERRFVDDHGKAHLLGGPEAPRAAGAEGESPATGTWRLVESFRDPLSGNPMKPAQPIDGENTLLTLSQSEAVAFGFASGIADDVSELAALLGLKEPPTYHDVSGWESFAMWLNSPLVRGVLLMLVLVGAYMEFQSPGLIFPGVTAAVALVIFLAAPYAAGLANVWHILLLAAGLALLAVEIFIIPGFGIVGLSGAALILVALLATFVPGEPGAPPFSWPQMDATWSALLQGVKVLVGGLAAAILGIAFLLRYLPQARIARRLMSANPHAAGLAIADAHPTVARPGDVGVVTGDLRPGGLARFGDEVVDVQTQGEYVEAGRLVQVVRREGMSVIVRPLDAAQPDAT